MYISICVWQYLYLWWLTHSLCSVSLTKHKHCQLLLTQAVIYWPDLDPLEVQMASGCSCVSPSSGNLGNLFQCVNLYPLADVNVLAANAAARPIYESRNTNNPDLTLKTRRAYVLSWFSPLPRGFPPLRGLWTCCLPQRCCCPLLLPPSCAPVCRQPMN